MLVTAWLSLAAWLLPNDQAATGCPRGRYWTNCTGGQPSASCLNAQARILVGSISAIRQTRTKSPLLFNSQSLACCCSKLQAAPEPGRGERAVEQASLMAYSRAACHSNSAGMELL